MADSPQALQPLHPGGEHYPEGVMETSREAIGSIERASE